MDSHADLRTATMSRMTLPRMPVRTASTVTFFYALGYPVGNAAVAAMSPMAVLVFRFGLAAAILGTWARAGRGGLAARRANSATSPSPAC